MYIPHTDEQRQMMLDAIGVSSVDDLFADVPTGLPVAELDLPVGADEMTVFRRLSERAAQNRPVPPSRLFLGAGAYTHFIPAVVDAMISRGEFLTSYTPYQPEASQGTLTAIYEFQSMVASLYGLEVANASLYDGASALAEAAIVAVRHTGRSKVLVSETVHPHYRQTLHTYLARQPVEIITMPHREGTSDVEALVGVCDKTVAAMVLQHPNFFGRLEPLATLAEQAHRHGTLVAVSGHPLAFGVLAPPGVLGADLACGEGQPLGLPLSYGGPYVGLLAARRSLVRKLPGRLVGKTVDAAGNPGYVLTLQTREQHIRREKATSNICTNQGLCALAATVYLSLLGPVGLAEVATRNVQHADRLRRAIRTSRAFADGRVSFPFDGPCFNEFVLQVSGDPDVVLANLRAQGIVGGVALRRWFPALDRHLLVCTTEVHTAADHAAYVSALEAAL